jgi:hypothetical protein
MATSRLVVFKGESYRPHLGKEGARKVVRAACQCLEVSEAGTDALCHAPVFFARSKRKHAELPLGPGASTAHHPVEPVVLEACDLTINKAKRVSLPVVSARCSLLAVEGKAVCYAGARTCRTRVIVRRRSPLPRSHSCDV